jgi:DNA-binding response OmpR family regulator
LTRILVVDDEIQMLRLLQKFLISKSYEVIIATNGTMAIQKVEEMKPDIVLLDIMMPGVGGIHTLKEIKMINPKIKVIMITALIDEEIAIRTIQLGAADYIMKPINIDYLETCLLVNQSMTTDNGYV